MLKNMKNMKNIKKYEYENMKYVNRILNKLECKRPEE